jgi:uncharacterized NAD(P)/FAD-binding protein YdhS
MSDRDFTLAIVGGGPTCTYVVERLAAVLRRRTPRRGLKVHVYDREGDFGSGQAHSSRQPQTSILNRICGQISFGADETNPGVAAAPSLAPYESLHEWCRARFAETSDSQYLLGADSWPRRYLHGRALEEVFGSYVGHLKAVPGADVALHASEVVAVVPAPGGRLTVVAEGVPPVDADHIVFATGHGAGRPKPDSPEGELAALSAQGHGTFIPYAYPLDRRILPEASGTDKTVCSLGLGLTAIDLILYLTEGRGGAFAEGPDGLEYRASGAEPAAILGCSQSGLFTYARARNEKEVDLAALEHKGVFLTAPAIDRMRASSGRAIYIPGIGARLQLDFESQVFPLVLLEMTYVYYKTLFGKAFADQLAGAVSAEVDRFIEDPEVQRSRSHGHFDSPVEPLVAGTLAAVAQYLETGGYQAAAEASPAEDFEAALASYLTAILGEAFVAANAGRWADPDVHAAVLKARSPWLFPLDPASHRFDWNLLCNPIPEAAQGDRETFLAALIEFMELDHRRAEQGNVRNPWKAACDGVWRDLRSILTHVVDRGGLTAGSHRLFLRRYMRFHNRLANGACLEAMEKMLALVKGGLLDVGMGPLRTIRRSRDGGRFELVGTAAAREVDTIVDSKLHTFDPEHDESALYRQMFAEGLVRKWRNPGDGEPCFEPGGLDLSERFHPLDPEGNEDVRITFLGPPTEGILFFQVGAARPNQNHHVLNDVIVWVEEFEAQLLAWSPADAREVAVEER